MRSRATQGSQVNTHVPQHTACFNSFDPCMLQSAQAFVSASVLCNSFRVFSMRLLHGLFLPRMLSET